MSNSKHTQQTDREKALEWWRALPDKTWSALKKKHNLTELSTDEAIIKLWRSETQSPSPVIKGEGEDLKVTKGEWELHLGRHKEDAPIFGWGIRVKGKAAHLALQGVYEHNTAVGLGLNGEPVDILFTPEEAEANGRLLAASKDLYLALKEMILVVNGLKLDSKYATLMEEEKKAIESAHAALKKANPLYNP